MMRPCWIRTLRQPATALLAALLLVAAAASPAMRAQSAPVTGPIVVPTRRAVDEPPHGPPELPASARGLTPLRLDVDIRREVPGRPPVITRQVVTRTAERAHLALGGDREWLFVRNPVDNRRVDGLLIVHARRTIVRYDESAVRNGLGLRGWADVLTLGLDLAAFAGLEARGGVQERGGLRVVRYSMRTDTPSLAPGGVEDVWWCEAQALPVEFTVRSGDATTVVKVGRISTAVEAELLRPPTQRFPDYVEVDLAEWLEDL